MNPKKQDFRLILASGSPRRRELLGLMGYTFEIIVPDVDEHVDGHAKDIVAILSQRKAHAVADGIDHGIVIASDTLVSLDGVPLGKPEDVRDARNMLSSLSGRTHEVFTGVTIIDSASKASITEVVRTGVAFRQLTDDEIDAYIQTGEPMDKAGAYAIQGGAGKFVESFDGSFENVVGFPVAEIQQMIDRITQ